MALASHAAEKPLALPTPEQVAWQDMELEMFIHFGPATWQDTEYDTLNTPLSKIDPAKLDTDQWAEAAGGWAPARSSSWPNTPADSAGGRPTRPITASSNALARRQGRCACATWRDSCRKAASGSACT